MVTSVYDITGFMSWFILHFFNLIGYNITLLSSFRFFGFSFLDFLLAILGISVLLSFFIVSDFHELFKYKEKNPKGGKK